MNDEKEINSTGSSPKDDVFTTELPTEETTETSEDALADLSIETIDVVSADLSMEESVAEASDLVEMSDIYESSIYSCFALKVKGASHIRDNTNCQDSFKISTIDVDDKTAIIATVADGHGSKKYYLSEFGACILTDCLQNVLHNILQKKDANFIDIMYKRIKEELPMKLFTTWSTNVLEDYSHRVENGNECEMESELDILVKYGTTAMFCVSYENSLLFGKLDGNIVVVEDDECYEPICDDDDLMGSEAYSMCNRENALNKWNFGISHSSDFLTVSTDGLRNAFGDDDDNTSFLEAIKTINEYIKTHEIEETRQSLPPFLRRCSDNGSADDITLVCFSKKPEGTDNNG